MKKKFIGSCEYYILIIWIGLIIIGVVLASSYYEDSKEGIVRGNYTINESFIKLISNPFTIKYTNLSLGIHCDEYKGNVSFYYGKEFHIDTNCEEMFERR